MSYKYQNGSTPDHVDSSMSDANYPHTGIPISTSDSIPKKPAPIDTVRLKKDMDKDMDAASTLTNTGSQPNTINDLLRNGPHVGRETSAQQMDRGADALIDRAFARRDSLDAARAGKIPVRIAKVSDKKKKP